MSARTVTLNFLKGRGKVGPKTFWADIRREGYAKGRRNNQYRSDMSNIKFSKGSSKIVQKSAWPTSSGKGKARRYEEYNIDPNNLIYDCWESLNSFFKHVLCRHLASLSPKP